MTSNLASAITKAASKQTYYTIRFLVDRPRMEDAYRAYAYFRWVDDVLDAEAPLGSVVSDVERFERRCFLDRQKSLLDQCLRGVVPRDVNRQEAMLVELIRRTEPVDAGLEAYLRHMMLVMDFDVRRRGLLVSQAELNEYTGWLATAVTEAMHHFIGNGAAAPHDETRYLAVSGAHILHMLRDTYQDMRAGYFNVPREMLEAHSIGPEDVHADAYRAWVEGRVRLARAHFDAGRAYFARVQSPRHRVAGLAYIARFEWLIETIEREDFRLRPRYAERRSLATGLRMSWQVLSWMIGSQGQRTPSTPIASRRDGRP
jgi:phytoene/squalene synthetase